MDQDPLGKPGRRVAIDGDLEVWARDMEDGTKAVGLFNRGEDATTVTAKWSDLGLKGKRIVRDLWRQQDLGRIRGRVQDPGAAAWRGAGAAAEEVMDALGNIQQPTSNIQHPMRARQAAIGCSMLVVGCWMLSQVPAASAAAPVSLHPVVEAEAKQVSVLTLVWPARIRSSGLVMGRPRFWLVAGQHKSMYQFNPWATAGPE